MSGSADPPAHPTENLIPASRTFEPRRSPARERLPVTVVTGFLGSGKTTLVNHILTNNRGIRAAVLVNEFGEIGIDNELIVEVDGGVIELSNGCICCSMNEDLVDGLVRILTRDEDLDHLIIETSGVSDPLPVALTILRPEFRTALRLDAIVAVADAYQFSLDVSDATTAQAQFRYADVVLINKSDLVDDDQLDRIAGRIAVLAGAARQIRTTRSVAPLPLILDVSAHPDAPIRLPDIGHRHRHNVDEFVSVSFESADPFSLPRFHRFLNADRPPGLFRAKGFLWIAETNDRYLFHLVGGRFTLEKLDHKDDRSNRLVFIGQGLDPSELRARLQECLA